MARRKAAQGVRYIPLAGSAVGDTSDGTGKQARVEGVQLAAGDGGTSALVIAQGCSACRTTMTAARATRAMGADA